MGREDLEKRRVRDRTRAQARRAGTPIDHNRGEDPLVVRTADLAALLCPWIENHNQHNDTYGTGYVKEDEDLITGLQYLEHWSGVNVRQIRNVCTVTYQWTAFRIADRLLTAAGLNHHFGLDIHVVPNPKWSTELFQQYQAEQLGCCTE